MLLAAGRSVVRLVAGKKKMLLLLAGLARGQQVGKWFDFFFFFVFAYSWRLPAGLAKGQQVGKGVHVFYDGFGSTCRHLDYSSSSSSRGGLRLRLQAPRLDILLLYSTLLYPTLLSSLLTHAFYNAPYT